MAPSRPDALIAPGTCGMTCPAGTPFTATKPSNQARQGAIHRFGRCCVSGMARHTGRMLGYAALAVGIEHQPAAVRRRQIERGAQR